MCANRREHLKEGKNKKRDTEYCMFGDYKNPIAHLFVKNEVVVGTFSVFFFIFLPSVWLKNLSKKRRVFYEFQQAIDIHHKSLA